VGNDSDQLAALLQDGNVSSASLSKLPKPSSRFRESTRTLWLAIFDKPNASLRLTIKLSPPDRFLVERISQA